MNDFSKSISGASCDSTVNKGPQASPLEELSLEGTRAASTSTAPGTPDLSSVGGKTFPLPHNESGYYQWVATPKQWRKRHPVLFWGGLLLLVLFLGKLAGTILSTKGMLGGPQLAVVSVEGVILDSKSVISWITVVEKDPAVLGVLVRVNSPGGAIAPSQEIYLALERLAAKKPVVVSMGALAASGGYYVSLPSNRIFAVPSTLTGSIGVKMDVPNFEGLMQTLGISSTTLKSGELKDVGSVSRAMTAKEQEYLQAMVNDMYGEFIDVIVKHRKLPREKVLASADGRGITGRNAVELGLIDAIGDERVALDYLKTLCSLSPETEVTLLQPPVEANSLIHLLTNIILDLTIKQSAYQQQPVFMLQ